MKKNILNKALTLSLFIVFLIFAGCTDSKNTSKSVKENESSVSGSGHAIATNDGTKSKLIPAESSIEWTGEKVTGKHNGTVDLTTGSIYINNGELTGGEFEVDFGSIKVLDIKDEAMNMKLTNHLKSNDFFSAEMFPRGSFAVTSINKLDENKYEVKGNMNIKNITNEVSFPVEIKSDGNKLTASADIALDRTKWDVKYRSGKFYENLGDNLISDEFKLKLNLTFENN